MTCRAVLEFCLHPLSASVPDSAQHSKGELSTLAQKQTTELSRMTFPSPNSETVQFITEKKEKEQKKSRNQDCMLLSEAAPASPGLQQDLLRNYGQLIVERLRGEEMK